MITNIHEDVIAFVRYGWAVVGDIVHTTDNQAYLVTQAVYNAVMRPVDVTRNQRAADRLARLQGVAA